MRLRRQKAANALAGLLALSAMMVGASCGATRPVSYYTLDAKPMLAPAEVRRPDSPLPVSIVVGRISASPLYLDSPIVYQISDVKLGTYSYDRWAVVPTEMLETMLTQALSATGRFRSVTRLGNATRGDYLLRGHLYALDEVDSPSLTARFSLEVELIDQKRRTVVWTQTYDHSESVSRKNVSAVVEALRQNVAVGIGQLTGSLDTYFADAARR
ncbi:MAG: membrane integrity-associated transporter subunit PqiC [Acidobacteriota bacterium]|nr:membrane integrity-associated transporter subunit PqiC [Acidobacteriota bacterium]